jgi:hypothetical protein
MSTEKVPYTELQIVRLGTSNDWVPVKSFHGKNHRATAEEGLKIINGPMGMYARLRAKKGDGTDESSQL